MTSSLIYNATIAGFSISTAFELGLLDRIAEFPKGVNFISFCEEKNLDFPSTKSMIFAMQCFQILNFDLQTGTISQGIEFENIYKDKGYFLWMVQGYGKFLLNLSNLLSRQNCAYERDSASIALAGKDYGTMHVDPHVEALLSEVSWNKIADLGCGSANRILQIVKKWKCQAVGVEIQSGAIEIARQAVNCAQMQDFVQIIQGDVNQLMPNKEFEGVDLITSFFMGHDLWPRENCVKIFRHIKTCFPNVRYFLFCDTFCSNLPPSPEIPTFTLGFEFFHALMRQYIPDITEWRALFEESGWECIKDVQTGIPFTNIFVLTPMGDH